MITMVEPTTDPSRQPDPETQTASQSQVHTVSPDPDAAGPSEAPQAVPGADRAATEDARRSSSPERLPTPEQLTHFIENDAFHQVLNQYQDHRFFTLTQDRLSISMGLKRQPTDFVRQLDGTVQARKDPGDRQYRNGPEPMKTKILDRPGRHTRKKERYGQAEGQDNPFHEAWSLLTAETRRQLDQAVLNLFTVKSDPGPDQPAPGSRFQTEKLNSHIQSMLFNNEKIKDTLSRAAKGILANLGNGNLNHPTALGYHLLYQLLGKDKISATIAMAGEEANLEEFNIVVRSHAVLSQAYAANPNAVSLWFKWYRTSLENSKRPKLQLKTLQSPALVIQAARKQFNQELRDQARHYPGLGELPAEDLWTTFTGMNHQAVKRYFLNEDTDRDACFQVAALVHESGANPPCSSIRSLFFNKPTGEVPRAFRTAYLRESEQVARSRTPGRTLAQLHQQYKLGCRQLHQEQDDSFPEEESTQWSDWMARMDPAVRDPALPERKPRRDRNNAPKRPSRTYGTALQQIMAGPGRAELTRILGQPSAQVTINPGHSVSLQIRANAPQPPAPETALELWRHPDGSIEVSNSPEYWLGFQQELPDPRQCDNQPAPGWILRGLATARATQIAHQHLLDHWQRYQPSADNYPPTSTRPSRR